MFQLCSQRRIGFLGPSSIKNYSVVDLNLTSLIWKSSIPVILLLDIPSRLLLCISGSSNSASGGSSSLDKSGSGEPIIANAGAPTLALAALGASLMLP